MQKLIESPNLTGKLFYNSKPVSLEECADSIELAISIASDSPISVLFPDRKIYKIAAKAILDHLGVKYE